MGMAHLALAFALFGSTTIACASPTLTDLHQTGSTLLITQLGSESNVLGVAAPSAPGAASVPEPASTGLLVLGLAGLACRFRRRQRVVAR